jgi:hypothetical protein
VSGEYREFVPNRRLLMTWTHEGPASAPDKTEALVTVDLREAGRAATELTVTEEPVAPDQRDDANAAWTRALDASKHSWPTPPASREARIASRFQSQAFCPANVERSWSRAVAAGSHA